MPRPIQCQINIKGLSANLALLSRKAGGANCVANTWAVVKANAYGHGIEAAVRAFDAAQGLAMLDFAEASRARGAGWRKPILMLEGAFDDTDIAQACALGLDLSLHDEAGLVRLEANLARLKARPIRVWIKVNTGMNRLGFKPESVQPTLARLSQLVRQGALTELGMMTHFARADDDRGVEQQMQTWERIIKGLDFAKLHVNHVSLCNSAASLRWMSRVGKSAQTLWIRPGVALYGATPFAHTEASAQSLGLVPAQSLLSQIIAIQEIAAGDEVGYGGNFVAQSAMRIGVVACGYADGYPRIARNGTPVLVEGVRTGIVGRVSMDMLTVDLGPVSQAKVGSAVELWGPNLAIDEVAGFANTIGYELMCAVAPRVPQVWNEHG